MSLPIFGAQAAVSILNRVFTNTSPAASVFNNQVSNATSSLPAGTDSTDVLSYTAFAKTFGTAYASQSASALSTLILTNMGLLPNDGLQVGLADYLTAAGKENVGIVALQLSSIISGMGSSAIYGAASVAWNAEVTSAFTYSSNPANTTSQTGDVTAPPANQGQTFTLTTGVDTVAGSTGDDTVNATDGTGATTSVLGGLDNVDGGAGNDTLNIADAMTGATAQFSLNGATVKNVETLNVTSNGSFGKTGTSTFDISGVSGLTTATLKAAGTANSNVTLGAAQTLNLTVSGTAKADVIGGKVVNVTAGTGTVNVGGAAVSAANYTSVAVTGGTGGTIDNASATGASEAGTTLTSVSLTKVDGDTAVKGAALTTLTVAGATSATRTITVNNGTAAHALTVNVDGTGIDSASTSSAFLTGGTVLKDTIATAMTINATGTKSSVDVSASSSVKALTVTGSADLTLAAAPAVAVTSIDGSAATGKLTLGTLNAAVVTLKTGSGNDSATLQATAKATADTGAGNDTLTLGAILAAGSTVNLGAGNDTLLGTAVPAASTTGNTTVIDGGEGTDSVSTSLINAGNAAQFKNFESLSLQGSTLDIALMTGSTVAGLTIDADATTTVSNATQAMGLTVNASSTSSTIGFTGVSGTTDTYAIKFAATTTGTATTPTSVDAGTVVVSGIETVSIDSGATAGVNANAITLTDSVLQTLNITGSQALTVKFTGTSGGTATGQGIALIDGSAATGKLTIDLNSNTPTLNLAAAGLTVKGGTAADTLTAAGKSVTFTGGSGADTFTMSANTKAGTADATTAAIVTISDATAADKISFQALGTLTKTTTDVATAVNLTNALDLALKNAAVTTGNGAWFTYGGNTYIVIEDANDGFGMTTQNDVVVKLAGTLDLTNSTIATNVLTIV